MSEVGLHALLFHENPFTGYDNQRPRTSNFGLSDFSLQKIILLKLAEMLKLKFLFSD